MKGKIKKEKKVVEKWNAFIFKFKCMECSLHFMICTERKNEWMKRTPTCPECGNHTAGSFLRWIEGTKEFIFNMVPGHSELSM